MRGRGRRPVVAREGDRIIDGRLRARLLGLPLLDIEAQVVVATVGRPVDAGQVEPGERRVLPVPVDGEASAALDRAMHLLADGASALDEARRMHRRAQ